MELGKDKYNYAVSRSLEPKEIERQGIIATPDFYNIVMDNAGDFAVICSDGLTDVMDDETIIGYVQRYSSSAEDLTCDEISEQICKLALQKGAIDNVSVVIVSAV